METNQMMPPRGAFANGPTNLPGTEWCGTCGCLIIKALADRHCEMCPGAGDRQLLIKTLKDAYAELSRLTGVGLVDSPQTHEVILSCVRVLRRVVNG